MTQNGWGEGLHRRLAKAIKSARLAAGVSAQQLADETERLGYSISRSQIANYESGRKRGLDIAELLVVAAALNIPPGLLLFPDFPDGKVEVLPGNEADNVAALKWLSGRSGWQVTRDNAGTELVEAVAQRTMLEDSLKRLGDLIVKFHTIGHDHECPIARLFTKNFLCEKHHREALATSLCLPEYAGATVSRLSSS